MDWLSKGPSVTYRLAPLLSMARPPGSLNLAAGPVPLTLPNVPAVPASVVTTPVAMTIRRMVLLPLSATYRLVPLLSMARPLGRRNVAAVPVPSALPAVPAVLPARAVTTPVAMTIRRMVLLLLSATYRLVPLLSTARPWGWLNRAPVVPLALPDTPALPARVLTTPAGVILRMVWLLVPAVYRLPALSRTTPNWGGNPAASAVPSFTEWATAPPVPAALGAPAMVLATPAR